MARPKQVLCLILSLTVLLISGCATAVKSGPKTAIKTLPRAVERQERDYSVIMDDTEATAERLGRTVKDMNKRADELEKQAAEEIAKEAEEIEEQPDELLRSRKRSRKRR